MKQKGAGELYEILLAVIIFAIVIAFYGRSYATYVPVMLIGLGGLMVVGGLASKHTYIIASGIMVIALALVYSEVVH